MENPDPGAPVVELPERVDRRVRFGPFPSAKDALKFVCYAAAGAVLAPFATPFAWVPILATGFAVSVWRPDGEAIDERAGRWLVFVLHRWKGRSLTSPRRLTAVHGSVARLASGQWVTVVRAGGTPLAYRPPFELVSLFDRFRELLRASEGAFVLRSTTVPLREAPVLPGKETCSEDEGAARAGYRELVSVLCRRRRSRRVEIALGEGSADPEAARRLEERARSLAEHLSGLGVHPTLLGDRNLADSVRSFGWTLAGDPA